MQQVKTNATSAYFTQCLRLLATSQRFAPVGSLPKGHYGNFPSLGESREKAGTPKYQARQTNPLGNHVSPPPSPPLLWGFHNRSENKCGGGEEKGRESARISPLTQSALEFLPCTRQRETPEVFPPHPRGRGGERALRQPPPRGQPQSPHLRSKRQPGAIAGSAWPAEAASKSSSWPPHGLGKQSARQGGGQPPPPPRALFCPGLPASSADSSVEDSSTATRSRVRSSLSAHARASASGAARAAAAPQRIETTNFCSAGVPCRVTLSPR